MEQSLLKTNFVGRDGFLWWIGQVAPESAQKKQLDKEGWGNRRKVRIMGYHPSNEADLSNDDLPWAQVLLSTSDGSGAGNFAKSIQILPGDSVFGFFMDGDNAQLPVIIGVFGKTKEGASKEQFRSPFQPFTGYTSKIKNDGSNLKPNQTNEGTQETQKSPYHLPTKAANEKGELSYFRGIGDKVQFASTKANSFVDKITTELENAIKFVQTLSSYKDLSKDYINSQIDILCEEVAKKIQGVSSGIVGGVLNDTYKKIVPTLYSATELVYNEEFEKTKAKTKSISQAHLAGAAAQEATVPAIKKLQDKIPELTKTITSKLKNIIKQMLCALLKNIANLVSCVVDQFLGGILNAILGAISAGLNLALSALGIIKLISNFDLDSILKGSFKGISGVSFIKECGEEEVTASVDRWQIGCGVISSPSTKLSKILEVANTAASIVNTVQDVAGAVTGAIDAAGNIVDSVSSTVAGATGALDIFNSSISSSGAQSALGNCYAGPPKSCNPPLLNIFGGGGIGAQAIPIFGSILGETSNRVGSLIGAVITDPGIGYISAPFVEVTDNCNKGYGGIVQTTIDGSGQVTSAYVISDGENYPVGDQEPDAFTIVSVLIENPGTGYSAEDKVVDNLGNQYNVVIENGSIVKVDPINIKSIESLPVIEVVGKTNPAVPAGIPEISQGSGAILKPIFGIRPEFQGKVQQIIDCVKP